MLRLYGFRFGSYEWRRIHVLAGTADGTALESHSCNRVYPSSVKGILVFLTFPCRGHCFRSFLFFLVTSTTHCAASLLEIVLSGCFPRTNSTALSKKSEERRVGKECRYRWSP